MATLNRDSLIKASQKLKKIELEAGDIFIRLLSAHEVFEMKSKTDNESPTERILFELASKCICDKTGGTFMSPEDISLLDMETINKNIIEIYEFNNLNPDAVEKAKAQLKSQTDPKDLI